MKWFLRATLLALLCFPVAAAPKPKLAERYSKWLNQDVVYIITDEERKAFLNLSDDDKRDKFIEDFWDIRNPSPGSASNAYKEEHYRRLDYVNSHFGRESNTPGWMTDQGRTWILLGKPTSQHPFTGYSQIYPLELWFYDNPIHSPSFPAFFYVMFYMPLDLGEYKFYRPFLDGPMKLVRGSQFNSNADVYKFLQPLGGDVAHAAFSLVAGDPIDTRNFQPDMSSDMMVNKIENLANDRYNLQQLRAKRSMRTFVTSRVVVEGKELHPSTIVLTDPVHEKWLDYSVPVDDEQMGFQSEDQKFVADFRYRLMTANGGLVLEDDIQEKYAAYESSSGFKPFQISGRIPVVAGNFRLEVQIVNHKSGRSYRGEVPVSVPAQEQTPWLSGPLLADSVSRAAEPNSVTPYQYYGVQFHPISGTEFAAKRPMRVLFQLYEPQPADCEVEYVLANLALHDARIVTTDHVKAAEFSQNLLLKSKTLDTGALPSGEYMLAIHLKSSAGPVVASSNQRVRLVEGAPETPMYFLNDPRKLASPGLVDYMRGLAAIALRDDAGAQKYLERSLKLNPANNFGKQFLVQSYYHQHLYKAVSDLYRSSSLKDFEVSPEAMAQIAVSLWDSGDSGQAKTVLKSARTLFPEDQLLAATDKLFSKVRN